MSRFLIFSLFLSLYAQAEERPELGRDIASVKSDITQSQLLSVQGRYNQIRYLKNLNSIFKAPLSLQDQKFLKEQNSSALMPKASRVGNQIFLTTKEGVVKVAVMDLKSRKFSINDHLWQLSQPVQLKSDVEKINQVLSKSQVLDMERSSLSTSFLSSSAVSPSAVVSISPSTALAIYSLGYLGSQQE